MKYFKSIGVAFATCLIAQPANAFDFSVTSSVADQDVSQACLQAIRGFNAPKMRAYCQSMSIKSLLSDAENSGYDMMGEANKLMPLSSYYLSHKKQYWSGDKSPDAIRANAEWKSNGLTAQRGYWLAAPTGQYLDLNNLTRLSIRAELVRIDFGSSSYTGSGTDYDTTLGMFSNDKDYTYQDWRFGADFHYRYTVKWDARPIYDGFIINHQLFGEGRICPTGSERVLEDCKDRSGPNNTGEDFLRPSIHHKRIAAELLSSEISPLSDITSYDGSELFKSSIGGRYQNKTNNKTAQNPNLSTYAGSFQIIEGGRAKFGYRQLSLFTAAQQNAPSVSSGGGIANTAKFLADQQYCAQFAKSLVQEDKSFRSGLGFVAGMAGFGEAANAINTAGAITNISEGLSGRELDEANSCMQERGHTSIDDAAAMDGAAAGTVATYVPYTSGTAVPHSGAPLATIPSSPALDSSANAYTNPKRNNSLPTSSYQDVETTSLSAPHVLQQVDETGIRQFRFQSGNAVVKASDMGRAGDILGALNTLKAALNLSDLNAYEQSMINQMAGQYSHELNRTGEAIQFYERSLASGGHLPDEAKNLKDVLEQLKLAELSKTPEGLKSIMKKSTGDRDAQPLVRIPPIIPARFLQGDHSGYCKVRFDVTPDGAVTNLETTVCTSRQLENATLTSVSKWRFTPKVEDGLPIMRKGVESTIRFDLQDERGRKLPLPDGF